MPSTFSISDTRSGSPVRRGVAEDTVVTEEEVTGHAETNLVRIVSSRVPADVRARSTLYTSTDPRPMCAGAIH